VLDTPKQNGDWHPCVSIPACLKGQRLRHIRFDHIQGKPFPFGNHFFAGKLAVRIVQHRTPGPLGREYGYLLPPA
jgi:hypothetical protein